MQNLMRSLQRYWRERHGVSQEPMPEVLDALCKTLSLIPADAGVPVSSSVSGEVIPAMQARLSGATIPEARLCQLWLECVTGNPPTDAAVTIC